MSDLDGNAKDSPVRPWFKHLVPKVSPRKRWKAHLIEQEDGPSNPYRLGPMSSKRRKGGNLAAVFVHAGAGFHSYQNERVHLSACEGAVSIAMSFLKSGATAVDAVEMALKTLEDNEITNAGYGSNLTMEGVVEGDATIIDHLGRSGAVGAIGSVANPIHTARIVLEESTKPLSLRRVPPNLLAGAGAADFAFNHGVPLLPPDYLVSEAARDRYEKWSKDLISLEELEEKYLPESGPENAALQNEAQPMTPPKLENQAVDKSADVSPPYRPQTPRGSYGTLHAPQEGVNRGPDADDSPLSSWPQAQSPPDSPEKVDIYRQYRYQPPADHSDGPYEDVISDTVGAIAIDCFGNIAAGSSSGGIGMKHKGRIGPAALVGIGTAVCPTRPNDKTKTCVAVVASGTGEHMATTVAAQTCASRLYSSQKLGKSGVIEETFEDEALKSFILSDFMAHPSVKHSHAAGAIGVMAVKKNADGIYLYFGHNTDSFALACMSSEDSEPYVAMSRMSPSDTGCSIGARALRSTAKRGNKKQKNDSRSRTPDAKFRTPDSSPSRESSSMSIQKANSEAPEIYVIDGTMDSKLKASKTCNENSNATSDIPASAKINSSFKQTKMDLVREQHETSETDGSASAQDLSSVSRAHYGTNMKRHRVSSRKRYEERAQERFPIDEGKMEPCQHVRQHGLRTQSRPAKSKRNPHVVGGGPTRHLTLWERLRYGDPDYHIPSFCREEQLDPKLRYKGCYVSLPVNKAYLADLPPHVPVFRPILLREQPCSTTNRSDKGSDGLHTTSIPKVTSWTNTSSHRSPRSVPSNENHRSPYQ